MVDIYRTEDVITLVLVILLLPALFFAFYMAMRLRKPVVNTIPPPLKPHHKLGLGAILMEYPNLKEIMVVTRELELRIHRMSREAQMVADEQRYLTALSVLKEVTPECTEAGVREFHDRLRAVA